MTHQVPAEWSGLDDHALAGELAAGAGRLLVAHRDSLVSRGTTHWMLCDTGDALGHDFLTDALRATRPADSVLSEEGADDRTRLTNDRVWIVDPLDGTNEYGENRGDWAVHVALWEKGRLAAGAVALPAIDRVFLTDPAPVIPPRPEGNPRLVTSRNRAPYAAVVVANAGGIDGAVAPDRLFGRHKIDIARSLQPAVAGLAQARHAIGAQPVLALQQFGIAHQGQGITLNLQQVRAPHDGRTAGCTGHALGTAEGGHRHQGHGQQGRRHRGLRHPPDPQGLMVPRTLLSPEPRNSIRSPWSRMT